MFTTSLSENLRTFHEVFLDKLVTAQLYHRPILSPMGREVVVWDETTKSQKTMLMFGSNNYLGIANDPFVKQRVREAIDEHGVGMGGPMLLNGTSALHKKLEEKLAEFKGKEAVLLVPSGYMTNLAWITTLLTDDAILLYDEASHASVADGVCLGKKKAFRFNHNDPDDLKQMLERFRSGKKAKRDIFVTVQGVYSMNGELCPLPEILSVCEKYDASLVIDDAHGTGVMGGGKGTAEHFGVAHRLKYAMGTFSKAFAVTGGFFAGDRKVIEFMRFLSRPYFFSASISPLAVATVLAGLELIEREPSRIARLHANADRLRRNLKSANIRFYETNSAIIPVFPNNTKYFREMALAMSARGLFVNAIETPGVPSGQERFRVTVMSQHTSADIDKASDILVEVFAKYSPEAISSV